MPGRRLVINGKFLAAGPTGVHRVARALIEGMDALRAASPPPMSSWRLIQPRDAKQSLSLATIPSETGGVFTWQPWEQFDLPRLAGGDLLLNLCNLAPLAATNSVTMIHDAQVFISPDSYSRAFRAWYQFALPRIGAQALRVLTVSQFSAQQLAAHGVAPLAKIDVIPNGCDHIAAIAPDPDALAGLGLKPGRYAVALANTQKHKNIAMLLRAFAQPRLSGVPLVLVGHATAAQFAALGAPPPPNAIFAGPVSDGRLRALLEGATCLCFPSTTEGFGLPPLEAMYLGCPAIAAPLGALPEVCGDAALYADAEDERAWADGVCALMEDEARRAGLIERGKANASRFSWSRSAQLLLDIVEKSRRELA